MLPELFSGEFSFVGDPFLLVFSPSLIVQWLLHHEDENFLASLSLSVSRVFLSSSRDVSHLIFFYL